MESGQSALCFSTLGGGIINTTNAIESVHSRLRKIIESRGHFPGDKVASKLTWLVLRNIAADWKRAKSGNQR